MSKGLTDLQSTVQSFSGSQDAINNYVQNYDSSFFQNWKEKVDLATSKLETAEKVANGIGGVYIGGKALNYSINAFKNKYFNKDAKSPSDEDGTDEVSPEEPSGSGGQGSSTGNADNVEDIADTETLGDGTEVVNRSGDGVVRPTDTDVSGEQGTELMDMKSTPQPAQTTSSGDAVESSFVEQQTPTPKPQTTQSVQPEIDDFVENPPQSQEMSVMGQTTQPSTSGGSGTGDSGQVGLKQTDIQNQIQEADPEAGLTAETGAETGADIGAEIGSAVTDVASAGADVASGAVLGALGVASDALGPIGLLAGVGIGLYELFHKPSSPPKPTPIANASSKGSMVLPSFDAVIDTPASVSAF
jgi:hypothetical protein